MLHSPEACCLEHAPLSGTGTPRQLVSHHPLSERDESAWDAVMARSRTQWPDPELDALIERTVTDIKRTVGTKRAAFAWTGATDSLVLAHVAGLAGIHRCVLAITELEYPAFLRWVTDCMPDGLTVVSTGLDLRWLRDHPSMLFPDAGTSWQTFVQHRAHEQFYQDRKLGMLLLGGRRAGGYAYGPGKELTWKARGGVVRYTPLVDWSREAMLALIQREKIPLPPCYGWPRGWQVGPGPWPARPGTTSPCHGYREVWSIDPDIIRSAAPQLPSAAQWLRVTGRS